MGVDTLTSSVYNEGAATAFRQEFTRSLQMQAIIYRIETRTVHSQSGQPMPWGWYTDRDSLEEARQEVASRMAIPYNQGRREYRIVEMHRGAVHPVEAPVETPAPAPVRQWDPPAQPIQRWVVERRLDKGIRAGEWVVVGRYRKQIQATNHCRRMSAAGHAMRMEPEITSGPDRLARLFPMGS